MAAQPSLYETIRQRHLATFPGTLAGGREASACVVGSRPLGDTARDALRASFASKGHLAEQVAFVCLAGEGEGGVAATPQQLADALEALDPLCVVATDRAAVEALSAGYNVPLALESDELLLGRPCRCFEDFAALIATEAGKRRAWASLKTLPSRR